MQKVCLFAFLFFSTFGLLQAQHGCDGSRYLDTVFMGVDTTTAIQFGSNTTIGGNQQDLFMDIYMPANDTLTNRPTVVLAFGGSFIGGDRTQLSDLCNNFALHGYVAVAIDYRIYDGPFWPLPDSNDMSDVAIKAVGDMKAAIRKLREDAANGNPYGIDPNIIIAGGVSAGAITALHAAQLDSTDNIPAHIRTIIQNNGGFEGNSSSNYSYSSESQAVLNYSGALLRAEFIDGMDLPMLSVHDDGDGTVPYNGDYANVFSIPIIYMEGSGLIHAEAISKGVPSQLITIPGSNGHVSYFGDPAWEDSVLTASFQFTHDLICNLQITGVEEIPSALSSKVFPNPSEGDITIQIAETLPSDYDVVLYNPMGQEVYRQQNLNQNQLVLARNSLPAGFYFLNIRFHKEELPMIQHKLIFR